MYRAKCLWRAGIVLRNWMLIAVAMLILGKLFPQLNLIYSVIVGISAVWAVGNLATLAGMIYTNTEAT